MAILVASSVGNQTGPGPSYFRVVAQFYATDTGSGYSITLRRYIEVTAGDFQSTRPNTAWTGRMAIGAVGNYGMTDTNMGTYSYGSTVSINADADCWAQYTNGSGTTYRSSVALSYTVPRPTYTVLYNTNGGSGAPGSQTKTYGITLTLSSKVPTRKGYKFLGWGTSSATTIVSYLPGATYVSNAAITLYAIWKKINNMALKSDGQIKKGKPWLNNKSGTPWIKANGIWKKGE